MYPTLNEIQENIMVNTTEITTTYAIIVTFQIHENYSFDDNGNPITGWGSHWKAKGGADVIVADGLTINEMVNIHPADVVKEFLDSDDAPKSDDLYRYSYLDYNVVERSNRVLDEAANYIKEASKYGEVDYWGLVYGIYNSVYELCEESIKWAIQTLEEQGRLTLTRKDCPYGPIVTLHY